MTTWNDFSTKAGKRDNWIIRDGEAIWTPLMVLVQIYVPPTELDPKRERVNLSLDENEVGFTGQFLSNEVVSYQEAHKFTGEWVQVWEGDPAWINLIDAPPPGFKAPESIDFLPQHYEKFKDYKISNTALAPLWGQHRSYFGEQVWELNAFGRMNYDKGVKWQQTWVEENLTCPFCHHTEWNLTYAMALAPSEAFVYDKEDNFYALICPSCERCVEAIPRTLIT